MLSNDDHPGLFATMVGMIVLVLAGVGLSLVVDRRLGFSSRVSTLEREIRAGEMELEGLKALHGERSRDLAAIEPIKRMLDALPSLHSRMRELKERRATLAMERDGLQNSIPVLQEEFSRYRAKYREITRNAAVGESLETLTTRDGREYHQAVISRVTDVGLEIRHEHGTARIQAANLDSSYHERFQWCQADRP